MTKNKENFENLPSSQRKQPFRFGTGIGAIHFLSVCSVLTFGFCKFSFYFLKNHRNAVDRPELTRSYADIRPFGEQKRTAAPDIFYTSQKKETTILAEDKTFHVPVIFENEPEAKQEKISTREEKNIPVENQVLSNQNVEKNKNIQNALITAYRSAPATNQAIKTSSNIQAPLSNISEEESRSVPPAVLDDLIVSGTVLLDETDEKLTQTAALFEEEVDDIDDINVSRETLLKEENGKEFDLAKEAFSEKSNEIVEEKKQKETSASFQASLAENKQQGTHWIDINALRAEIERQKKSSFETKTNETEYVSVKQMPDNQTASLPDASVSDIPSVVSEVPVDGTQSAKIEQKETVSKDEKASKEPVVALKEKKNVSRKEKKLAQKEAEKDTVKQKKKKKRKSPWKIAKVNGQSIENLAVNTYSSEEEEKDETAANKIDTGFETDNASVAILETKMQENSEFSVAAVQDVSSKKQEEKEPSSTVIYRNGKIKQVINADGTQTDFQPQTAYRERQNLEWLEGQEAAVWTNMSQSDVPSVWSFASNNAEDSDRAKAFKTAATDEPPTMPPADNAALVPAAPAQPAANEQPAAAPQEKKEALPALTLPTVKPLSLKKQNTEDKSKGALLGKMGPDDAPPAEGGSFAGKLLSLFSKEGESSSQLPSVGTNSPTNAVSEKKTSEKKEVTKNSSQKSMAALLKNLSLEKKKEETSVVPDEIRLTFKDGNSDLSASSVSLIKRFAKHANKDVQSVIEVRVSEQNPEIQQQRFAIIRNILLGSGVEDSQILLYQSGRPPNTLVLRTYIVSDEEYESSTSWLNGVEERLYYKKW